jgi:hypothetical protein
MRDRAEGGAYAILGTCHMYLEEYVKAVALYERCHAMSAELGMAHMQTHAMGMGVALRLEVRADRQGPAAGASQAPGPHTHWSASSCLDDNVREATKWVQVGPVGHGFARLHLAHLTWRRRKRKLVVAALAHLNLKRTSHDACNGDVTLVPVWVNAVRGHTNAHVQRLPCSAVQLCSADHHEAGL